MKNRTVKRLLYAQEVDMGGIPIRQPLPTYQVDDIDPFLLLHHHHSTLKEGTNARQAGVGPHPHRGFSPVTFIFKGNVHHRDSRGNSAVVEAGGVQWMNAGMGVIHSERPSEAFAEKGGEQEIIQLWVNTPASKKLEQPAYFSLNKEEIPVLFSEDQLTMVKILAGTFNGVSGFNHTQSPMLMLEVYMQKGGEYTFPVDETYNLMLYNMDERIWVEGFGIVDGKHLVWFKNDGQQVQIKAQETTRFLLLAGQPLNEPVATYGPFVMNTQTEIMQAMRDYQMGKMGVLIEE